MVHIKRSNHYKVASIWQVADDYMKSRMSATVALNKIRRLEKTKFQ